MGKKTVFIMTLLSSIPTTAMELVHTKIDEQREVIIRLGDEQTCHTMRLPLDYAKLIGTLKELVEDPEVTLIGNGFPLINVTLKTWQLIEAQLARVYAITNDTGNTQVRLEIISAYNQLDGLSLIEVISAAHYLDIPILFEIACEVFKQGAPSRISSEEIILLPEHLRNPLILHKTLTLIGPAPAREPAVYKDREDRVWSVCITKDNKIVSGSSDATVCVRDVTGKKLAICKGNGACVKTVCVTKDGKIVAGSHNGAVGVWDMGGKELAIYKGHKGRVWSVCVTKDGKIVLGSSDNTVRVWNMEGKELAVCQGHSGAVSSVCVTKDGNIISGSWDNTVRVWNMQGKELAVFQGHEGSVRSVCVTKKGTIVSGSEDTTIRIWDIEGNQLAICRSENRGVLSVCITKDGKIVSGNSDGTVRVWDMNGNQLAVCRGHKDGVYSVCITKDGKIMSGSHDGTVRLWDIGLLNSIAWMDEVQAIALWKLLHRMTQYGIDPYQQKWWLEIESTLELARTDMANDQKVIVRLADDTITLPIRYAKLIGALKKSVETSNENINDIVFPAEKVTIKAWRLIEDQLERVSTIAPIKPQLERVYGITLDADNDHLKTRTRRNLRYI